jgi:hypothetical protein
MSSKSTPELPDFILSCFEKALASYPELQGGRVRLHQMSLRNMTMRAQPVVNSSFFNKYRRQYRIDMQQHTTSLHHINLTRLKEDVLVGWFAHELGHVMDYLDRPWWDLIRFGLGYWLFPTFRLGAERKADLFAIEHGFAEEINATKRFLLEDSNIPNSYKERLSKYYMTVEEVERIVLKRSSSRNYRDRVI